MDYTTEILEQLRKYYSKNPGCVKLATSEVEKIIAACNDETLWIESDVTRNWQVNPTAGQVRRKTAGNGHRALSLIFTVNQSYIRCGSNPRVPRSHVILEAVEHRPSGHSADHRNPNFPYDDRITNLRWSTAQGQALNRRPYARKQKSYSLSTSDFQDFCTIKEHNLSLQQAAEIYSVKEKSILQVTSRQRTFLAGVFWRRNKFDLLPGEKWRQLSEYGGHELIQGYSFSSEGRAVDSHGSLREPCVASNGYVQVSMRAQNGKTIVGLLHIIVCTLFHGSKTSEDHSVDHRNRDKLDNRASNLCWATGIEQSSNRSLPSFV